MVIWQGAEQFGASHNEEIVNSFPAGLAHRERDLRKVSEQGDLYV